MLTGSLAAAVPAVGAGDELEGAPTVGLGSAEAPAPGSAGELLKSGRSRKSTGKAKRRRKRVMTRKGESLTRRAWGPRLSDSGRGQGKGDSDSES
eukprot:534721-Rhodomonas_salina.1